MNSKSKVENQQLGTISICSHRFRCGRIARDIQRGRQTDETFSNDDRRIFRLIDTHLEITRTNKTGRRRRERGDIELIISSSIGNVVGDNQKSLAVYSRLYVGGPEEDLLSAKWMTAVRCKRTAL